MRAGDGRRGERTCSRKTRHDGSPSTSPGCRSCAGRRIATDTPVRDRRRRAAELEGAAVAGDAERRTVAKLRTGYRIVITNPLRSAATISPAWVPDSVRSAPF
jgi:hypothetical protein